MLKGTVNQKSTFPMGYVPHSRPDGLHNEARSFTPRRTRRRAFRLQWFLGAPSTEVLQRRRLLDTDLLFREQPVLHIMSVENSRLQVDEVGPVRDLLSEGVRRGVGVAIRNKPAGYIDAIDGGR